MKSNCYIPHFPGKVPANELQIYTWMDATLKELTGLVREVTPLRTRIKYHFPPICPSTPGEPGGAQARDFFRLRRGVSQPRERGGQFLFEGHRNHSLWTEGTRRLQDLEGLQVRLDFS